MSEWIYRKNAYFPYLPWAPFPKEAIVQVKNVFGETRIAPAHKLWWGHSSDKFNADCVISAARRLDKPKEDVG